MNTRQAYFSTRDFLDAITYALLLLPAWILPRSMLWAALRPLAILHSYTRTPSFKRSDWRRKPIIETLFHAKPREIDIHRLNLAYHEIATLLRQLRPGRARLPLELVGREHIDEGLASGRGVILLIAPFTYSNFVAKAAMKAAGISIVHLSIPGHASSGTRFGTTVITRIHTAVENRFIRERIVSSPDNFVGALKALKRRLLANEVVSITAISGSSSIQVPMLGASYDIGRAAFALCRTTGATLLPVFTVSSDSQRFEVRIGEPLKGEGHATNFEHALARAYGARLESLVRAHPTCWRGWSHWGRGVSRS